MKMIDDGDELNPESWSVRVKRTRMFGWAGSVLAVFAVGCTSPAAFFNPEFLTSLGLGSSVASIPGDAPAILVEVENRTSKNIEATISWRGDASDIQERQIVIAAQDTYSELVFCPVNTITMGQLSDKQSIGAVIRLGNGGDADAKIDVEPFGRDLLSGTNYDCGDAVSFTVQGSSLTQSGYQIFAFIRRHGAQ